MVINKKYIYYMRLTGIINGMLGKNSWVRPAIDIFVKSKQPWIELSGSTQKFMTLPPAE